MPELQGLVSADAILEALDELRTLTVLDDGAQSFRARAYGRALAVLRDGVGDALPAMTEAELVALPGVGATIARKIREYVDTGTMAKLERLRERYPPEYQRLVSMPGVGPKTLARLRRELGIDSLDRLQHALESGAVDALQGLGKGVKAALARGERFLVETGRDAWPIARVMPVAERIAAELAQMAGVERVQVSGELRRLLPMVREARLVAGAADPTPGAAPFRCGAECPHYRGRFPKRHDRHPPGRAGAAGHRAAGRVRGRAGLDHGIAAAPGRAWRTRRGARAAPGP